MHSPQLAGRYCRHCCLRLRRAGSTHAFDTMNHLFTYHQMIVPGSSYWNMGIGMMPGEVNQDEEGVRTMQVLGQNMAWLLKKLYE